MLRFTRLLVIVGLVLSMPAQAVNIYCAGNVVNLGMNNSGQLFVSVGHGTWMICSTLSQMGDVPPNVCRTWHASLLAAKIARTPVGVQVVGSQGCSSVGDWVYARVNYVN